MDKYQDDGSIGGGATAEVRRVTDTALRRQVAMKILRPEFNTNPVSRLHFVSQAQTTSQLEHPGIPPIHDIGETTSGAPYVTMKIVSGTTLGVAIQGLSMEVPEAQAEWSLHRLVGVVERLCETLHFAHERGVIHRDINPKNVVLGKYGEVHLMAWGVALVGSSTGTMRKAEPPGTTRSEPGSMSEQGDAGRTVSYMAPEQLRGMSDRRSDVYAVGCMLYEVLTLFPAFDPKKNSSDLVAEVDAAVVTPVRDRNPRRAVPEALAKVCEKAMAKEPSDRYPTAGALGEALRAWLDGTSETDRKWREAEALTVKGRELAAKCDRLRSDAVEAEKDAELQERCHRPSESIQEKHALFEARRRVAALRKDVALAFADAVGALMVALLNEAARPTVRAALSELWRTRLEEAEQRGEWADAAHALSMVTRYDDGSMATFVKGDGSLFLASEPSGAQVTLHGYVERDGILIKGMEQALGTTPIGPVVLPMGSYICILRMAGFRDVSYPIHITRNRTWKGRVRFPTYQEICAGFVFVPGGPFVYGQGNVPTILDLPDFAIARFPVTYGEYAEFLNALEREEGLDAVRRRIPRCEGLEYMERGGDGVYRCRPDRVEGAARARCATRYGAGFENRLPVVCVDCEDAQAYCDWKSRTTACEWRLPTEEEREKAARGVDGRRFPWGDLEDASLGKCRYSRTWNAQPEPVGAFPTSESVYGMGDAAGNIWEWTSSFHDARHELRVVRGGSWNSVPAHLEATYRGWNSPGERRKYNGFRCARGL